jgi:hypothetical protein
MCVCVCVCRTHCQGCWPVNRRVGLRDAIKTYKRIPFQRELSACRPSLSLRRCVLIACVNIYIYIYIYVCVCWVGMVSSEVIAVGYCILKVRFLLVTQKYLHKRPVAMLQYMDISALDAHPATCTGTYCADSNVCIFRLCVCFDEYLKPWAV